MAFSPGRGIKSDAFYRAKAARAARPARPMGAAVAIAAPLETVEEAAEAPDDSLEEEESVSVAVEVDVPVMVTMPEEVLVELIRTEEKPLMEAEALPMGVGTLPLLEEEEEPVFVAGVTTGSERPAGIEAAGCWEVTAAGCVVTGRGWPVTTPKELV